MKAMVEDFLLDLMNLKMNLDILSHFTGVLLGFPCDSIITIDADKNQPLPNLFTVTFSGAWVSR